MMDMLPPRQAAMMTLRRGQAQPELVCGRPAVLAPVLRAMQRCPGLPWNPALPRSIWAPPAHRTRDEAALAELYDRHSRLTYSVIMHILRSPSDAEEVLQETFVRVWSRAEPTTCWGLRPRG